MICSKRYLHAPQGPQIGFKEAWDTSRQRHPSGECISNFGSAGDPKYATLHAPPEFLHTRKSVFHLVPRDKTRIDGADRGADDPVGLDPCLMQRLIDAALISAERSAALQDENDLTIIVVADLVDG